MTSGKAQAYSEIVNNKKTGLLGATVLIFLTGTLYYVFFLSSPTEGLENCCFQWCMQKGASIRHMTGIA